MKSIAKTLPKYKRKRGLLDKLGMLADACLGVFLLRIGKEPFKPSTPRLAVEKWLCWLQNNQLPPVRGCVVVLALRNQTWMDWAFFNACWMRRLGIASIVLYSRKDVDAVYGSPGMQSLKQRVLMGNLWGQLERIPDVRIIDVDRLPEASADSLLRFKEPILKQVHTNVAYELYVEEYEQGPLKKRYDLQVEEVGGKMVRETAQAYELLLTLKVDFSVERFIGYSGTIGRSACYEEAAKEAGLFRVWAEGWSILPGLMRYNMNMPALHFDIKPWLEKLEWTEDDQSALERYISFQETGKADSEDRDSMKNHLNYQIVSKEAGWPDDLRQFIERDDRPIFLLAANVIGDSATFQCQTIFESQRSWVVNVIDFFVAHPEMKLIIRAHPSERAYMLKGTLSVNLGDLASEHAENVENVYVVKWQDPVNTYSLVPFVRAGLTWVSNTGIDLVIRDVVALSAANPAYGGLGITEEPASQDAYFSRIQELSKTHPHPSLEQKEMARKYLYVVYKKIGFPGHGLRYTASGLSLDQPLDSDMGHFYRILAGAE